MGANDSRDTRRPGRKGRGKVWADVGAADLLGSDSPVLSLPVPKDLVKPPVMHPEYRVTRARDAVVHFSTNTGVARAVWRGSTGRCALEALPSRDEVLLVHADVDLSLRRSLTPGVAYLAVDAMVCHLIPRAEGIGIVGKGPCRDAVPSSRPVAAETIYGVQEYRAR